MNPPRNTWAILVATKPVPTATPEIVAEVHAQTSALIARATAVAFPPRTCVIIPEEIAVHWRELATRVLPANVYIQPAGTPLVQGMAHCLADVSERDEGANCVVIPADHCAAVESAWIRSAQGALQLGSSETDTVYIIHDKPQNDPRTSAHYPGVCSSSVMVGTARSLLDLCVGTRTATIIDILVDDTVSSTAALSVKPLRVVHVTSVDEYAALQRGDYGRRPALVDLHA